MSAALSLLSPRELPSPNHAPRPDGAVVDMIVIQTVPARRAADAIARLCDPAFGVSVHYAVDGDGTAWRLVDESREAFHAGTGQWRGQGRLDARSIGVALVGEGRAGGDEGFPVLQLASVCDLCLSILSRHRIAARDIVGASDIAPERREDPGPLFDWEGLARNGVGLWPTGVPDLGTQDAVRDAASLRDARRALAAIGYRVAPEGTFDPALSVVLSAFQRHWRPEAVTGRADVGTLARLLAVARLCASEAAASP